VPEIKKKCFEQSVATAVSAFLLLMSRRYQYNQNSPASNSTVMTRDELLRGLEAVVT